jgi:Cupin-like domain
MTTVSTYEMPLRPCTRELVADFAREFRHQRPVLLDGVSGAFPMLRSWRVERLARMFAGRSFPCYESRLDGPISTMGDLREQVQESAMTCAGFLLRAGLPQPWRAQLRIRLSDSDIRSRLESQLIYPAGLLPTSADPTHTAVWLASPGSRTPVHRDGGDGLLCQIAGRKRAHIFAPDAEEDVLRAIREIRAYPGLFTEFEREHADATPPHFCVDLNPGQVLYIPKGWLHDIDSPDVSASLVLRN